MLVTGGAGLGLEKRRRAEFVQVIVCRRIEVSLLGWFCPWAASPQSNIFRNRTMCVFLPGAPSVGCWGHFICSLRFVCFLSCVGSHRGLGDPSSVAGTGELPRPDAESLPRNLQPPRECARRLAAASPRGPSPRPRAPGGSQLRSLRALEQADRSVLKLNAFSLLENRSVMLDRAEILLHDHYGGKEYWNVSARWRLLRVPTARL